MKIAVILKQTKSLDTTIIAKTDKNEFYVYY